MHAHYLQHVPFEGLGSIESWLMVHGYKISYSRLFESAALPDPEDIDLLIILGGPMSVNEEVEFPWLVSEKKFVRRVIDSGKPVLGICLGAQLIAVAMGTEVYANAEKEIGWYPIHAVRGAGTGTFCFPNVVEVFHWHGETFDLPAESVCLAKSEGCEHQAFQLGNSVIGLQFHLETTPDAAREIVSHCRSELQPSKFVQTAYEILQTADERYVGVNNLMVDVLDYLTRQTST